MASPAEPATQTEVEQAGHEMFPPFNSSTFPSQLLWFALIFGALYYYLSRRYLPAVGGMINARRARIAKDIDEATAMQHQASAAAAEHEKQLAKARGDAQSTAQAARDKVAAETEARRKALDNQLAAKIAQAEASIATTRSAAMANVSSIAKDTTAAIVEKLIGRAPELAAVDRAVDASARA